MKTALYDKFVREQEFEKQFEVNNVSLMELEDRLSHDMNIMSRELAWCSREDILSALLRENKFQGSKAEGLPESLEYLLALSINGNSTPSSKSNLGSPRTINVCTAEEDDGLFSIIVGSLVSHSTSSAIESNEGFKPMISSATEDSIGKLGSPIQTHQCAISPVETPQPLGEIINWGGRIGDSCFPIEATRVVETINFTPTSDSIVHEDGCKTCDPTVIENNPSSNEANYQMYSIWYSFFEKSKRLACLDLKIREEKKFLSCRSSSQLLISYFLWKNTQTCFEYKSISPATSVPQKNRLDSPNKYLSCCVEGLNDISFLLDSKFHTLTSLELNVNKIHDIRCLNKLPFLRYLSLSDNNISSLCGISSLRSIEVLNIDVNKLTNITELSAITTLVQLKANSNSIDSFPVLSAPRLEKLELYHNRIASLPSQALNQLTSLTHLNLGRNQLEYVSGSDISSCPLLRQLILSQNRLREFPRNLRLPLLECLWMSGNQLNSMNSWVFSDENPQFFLPVLERLYVQDNVISDFPTSVAANLPRLSELDLSFNSISSLRSIQSLLLLPRLLVLHLQDNPLTNSTNGLSLIELSKCMLQMNPNIRELSSSPCSPVLDEIYHSKLRKVQSRKLKEQRKFSSICNYRKLIRGHIPVSDTCASPNYMFRQSNIGDNSTFQHRLDMIIIDRQLDMPSVFSTPLHFGTTHSEVRQCDKYEAFIRQLINSNNLTDLVLAALTANGIHDNCDSLGGKLHFQAAIKIQSNVRRYITRSKYIKALSSARYVDQELDDILGENIDLNIFVDDGEDTKYSDYLVRKLDTSRVPLAYGDHIKMRTKTPFIPVVSHDHQEFVTSKLSTVSSVVANDEGISGAIEFDEISRCSSRQAASAPSVMSSPMTARSESTKGTEESFVKVLDRRRQQLR